MAMTPFLAGGLTSLSFGAADFMASQSVARIGAPLALFGMLLVSTLFLTGYVVLTDPGAMVAIEAEPATLFAALHGILIAIALVLFFHAMAIGSIAIVAPIIAAHPVIIVIVNGILGAELAIVQYIAIAVILIGVGIVGATGEKKSTKSYRGQTASVQHIVWLSILASLFYGLAILALQHSVPEIPETSALWLGRIFSLITIFLIIIAKRGRLIPSQWRWWPYFLLHGTLDTGGFFFILLGSTGDIESTITAVIASTFPLVTVALAWIIVKEKLSLPQGLGAAMIVVAVAFLIYWGHA